MLMNGARGAQREEVEAKIAEVYANHTGDEDPFFPYDKIEKPPDAAQDSATTPAEISAVAPS